MGREWLLSLGSDSGRANDQGFRAACLPAWIVRSQLGRPAQVPREQANRPVTCGILFLGWLYCGSRPT